jgi:hypothetical protein
MANAKEELAARVRAIQSVLTLDDLELVRLEVRRARSFHDLPFSVKRLILKAEQQEKKQRR